MHQGTYVQDDVYWVESTHRFEVETSQGKRIGVVQGYSYGDEIAQTCSYAISKDWLVLKVLEEQSIQASCNIGVKAISEREKPTRQ